MFRRADKRKTQIANIALTTLLLIAPCVGNINVAATELQGVTLMEESYRDQMVWPAPGHLEISSEYGSRYNNTDFHMGIDISDLEIEDSPVVASASGKVVDVVSEEANQGYGTCIVIAHGNNTFTRYAHLAKSSVSKGDSVSKGQMIGTVGNTGAANFPQLHFEVIKDGKTVNPLDYVQNLECNALFKFAEKKNININFDDKKSEQLEYNCTLSDITVDELAKELRYQVVKKVDKDHQHDWMYFDVTDAEGGNKLFRYCQTCERWQVFEAE